MEYKRIINNKFGSGMSNLRKLMVGYGITEQTICAVLIDVDFIRKELLIAFNPKKTNQAKITIESKEYDYQIVCSDETAERIHEAIWCHKNIEKIRGKLKKKEMLFINNQEKKHK